MPHLRSLILALGLWLGAGEARAGQDWGQGSADKTPYRWLVDASLGLCTAGEPPLDGSFGFHWGARRVQPGLELTIPVGDDMANPRTRGGDLAAAWSFGENGLQGAWAGARVGMHRSVHSFQLSNWRPRYQDGVEYEEVGWTLRGGVAAGYRHIFHPGFTTGAQLGWHAPLRSPPTMFQESPGLDLRITIGWADSPGRNPRPGYRSREVTGKVKPELIILPALAVLLVGGGAAAALATMDFSVL